MKALVVVFVITSLYTFIRYVTFGNVPLDHLPVYLTNKAVSLMSVSFLLLAAISYAKNNIDQLIFWGSAALQTAFIHVLLSLAILSSLYYPKLFDMSRMNLAGELTILFGVLAAYSFWRITHAHTDQMHKTLHWLASVLIALHLVAMGYGGWLKPEGWHGGLPPISLISFILVLLSLVLFSKKKQSVNE